MIDQKISSPTDFVSTTPKTEPTLRSVPIDFRAYLDFQAHLDFQAYLGCQACLDLGQLKNDFRGHIFSSVLYLVVGVHGLDVKYTSVF